MKTTTNKATKSDDTRTIRYIGKCHKCGVHTSGVTTGQNANRDFFDPLRTGDVFSSVRYCHAVLCRQCGERIGSKRVFGVYKPEHVCSDRCLSATGTSCECSCGGKNHGAGHSA